MAPGSKQLIIEEAQFKMMDTIFNNLFRRHFCKIIEITFPLVPC